MRQDQFEKLQALEEKLVDVFIDVASPEGWPGHGMASGAMDQQTRGDRYWSKKNAAATGVLVQRVVGLIGGSQGRGDLTPGAPEGDQAAADQAHAEQQLDDEIARAEREAQRIMNQLQRGARKQQFDAHTHGKK